MLGTALVVVERNGSPFAVSMLATALHFSTMVFAPVGGRSATRWAGAGSCSSGSASRRRSSRSRSSWSRESGRKRVIVLGVAVSGLYAVVLAAATLPGTALLRAGTAAAGFVVVAAGFSAMDTGTITYIADSVPAARESAFVGLRSTTSGIGGVVGPTLVGAAAALVGYRAAFAATSVIAFGAALLLAWHLEEPDRTAGPEGAFRRIERNAQSPMTAAAARRDGLGDVGTADPTPTRVERD